VSYPERSHNLLSQLDIKGFISRNYEKSAEGILGMETY
jgi:hypothetical protein